jgi:hypothetical protein
MAATFTDRAAAFARRCQNLIAIPESIVAFCTIPEAFRRSHKDFLSPLC